jgi:hypothetical protein
MIKLKSKNQVVQSLWNTYKGVYKESEKKDITKYTL